MYIKGINKNPNNQNLNKLIVGVESYWKIKWTILKKLHFIRNKCVNIFLIIIYFFVFVWRNSFRFRMYWSYNK